VYQLFINHAQIPACVRPWAVRWF